MSPVGAAILLLAGLCVLCLPRRFIVVPLLAAMMIVPRGEILVVAGFHLMPARIMPIFGWIRIMASSTAARLPSRLERWTSIDSAFLWCAVFSACAFILLWMQMAAVYNQVGILWGALGAYYLLRRVITTEDDVALAVTALVLITCVNAAGMVCEQWKLENLFGVYIGGVSPVPLLRDGKIRSQGAFGHSILAGTFAASMLPLCIYLYHSKKSVLLPAVGAISSLVMVYTCASSTPAISVVAGVFALALWPIRSRMRTLRWGIVGFLLAAQLVMKAPVWFLIAHMDVIGASSGYHRAELVDVFIKHFFDWWLVGTRDAGTWGWEMFDTSNQYVSKGESGGLLGLIFFIAIISRCFAKIGIARKMAVDRRDQWKMWCLGAALFAHVVGFFGISYWDQTEVAWFTLLAIISAASGVTILKAEEREKPAEVIEDLERPQKLEAGFDWASVTD